MDIPGRTIQLIVGQLENPSGDNSVMLVEPISNLPDQLYVGRSLSSVCSNQLQIQIMNISPSPVKVYKGIKLGTVIPSTGVLLVPDEDLQTDVYSSSSDHLKFPSLSTYERTELINLLKEFCDIFFTK